MIQLWLIYETKVYDCSKTIETQWKKCQAYKSFDVANKCGVKITPDINPTYGLMVRPYPNDLWQS